MTLTSRARALTGLSGVIAMTIGFLLLPAASGSQAATSGSSPSPSPSSSPTPSRGAQPARKSHTGTTVTGPRMYDPTTGKPFSRHSTVTVNQTTNLVNQEVAVSWTGFTPSTNILYSPDGVDYPVLVAECDTAKPTSWNQCYGANNGGVEGAFGAYGPQNTAYGTTAKNGTGAVDIQILTANENQFLNCGVHHQCALVIVPAQGGATVGVSHPNCKDHSEDPGGTADGQYAFSAQNGQCSWAARIIVPLHFAPAPSNCPVRNTTFTALGSPMLGRAMNQWIAALCAGPNPLTITYNSALTEPQAVTDVPLGLGDIALTTRPGPTNPDPQHSYTFAPLAISAVSIAYWIDSPVTGKPMTTLKLDPRLVAKLLTQSYNFQNEGCGNGVPPKVIGCDGAVDGNPFSLFADPEFRKLNPKVQAPIGYGAEFQIPTVEAGHSDMTWEITRWIANNADASDFMAGHFDPWGMHVNTDYLGLKYPIDSFTSEDPYPVIAHLYSPVFPLNSVAQFQAENWDPGTDWEKDNFGNFPKNPIQIPGERGLIAILDEGSAAAFRFPTAEIRNSTGHYVAPSPKSIAAALPSLIPTGDNKVTEAVDYGKQKADAYPLTMVIYAMVPTSHVSTQKADAIARFLDFVAGPGQKRGVLPGQLPPGFLPLTASMRAETLAAARKVLSGAGKSSSSPSASPSPSPSDSQGTGTGTGTGGTGTTGTGAGPSTSPAPSTTPTTATPSPTLGNGIVTVALKNAQGAPMTRYALPVLLIVGGLAALAGASSLVAGGTGTAITTSLQRVRRMRLPVRRRK